MILVSAPFFIALATAGAVQGVPLAVAVGLGLSVFSVVVYGRTVHAIEVGPTGLVLTAPFRTRQVAWRDVAGVALLHGYSGPALIKGLHPTVRIQPHHGKPIDFGDIAEGSIPLFDATQDAWQRARTDRRTL